MLDRHADALSERVRNIAAAVSIVILVAWLPLFRVYSPFYLRGGGIVVALCSAAIIWLLMTLPRGWLARTLAWEPFVWVGRRSYTLYLIHYPLFGLLTVGRHVAFAIMTPISLAYSAVSYRFLELRFLGRRTPKVST